VSRLPLPLVIFGAVVIAAWAGVPLSPAIEASRSVPAAHAQAGLPPLPVGWPGSLPLGMASAPGDAATLRSTAPFAFRYQYLSGGANTGAGWATWDPDGGYVTAYVDESIRHSTIPVFSYYMLLQSSPASGAGEGAKVHSNLQNAATMASYYADLRLFFRRAGAFPGRMVVLHVEPDLWGYMQQRVANDDAAGVSARVGSTGVAELAGLPDNLSGFARAIVRLRDAYAPNVVLGYSLSVWGTNVDISISDPSDAQVEALGTRAGNFYRSLNADFDVAFGEFSDRDSAFKVAQWGAGPEAWWDASDFRRHARFNAKFVSVAQKRLVLWQIPYGNTRMRAMDNSWGHYQDNRVEWLLDDPTRAHLNDQVQAGVVAFLFGSGADGATCACDAIGDGTTNPAAITGNTTSSYNADDDGGFFRNRAAAYYTTGAIALPTGGSASPTATPVPVACTPRPPVRVTTAAGGGRLAVEVAATGQNNHVLALEIARTTNALVDVVGMAGRTGTFVVALPGTSARATFDVRRDRPGAATVQLTVVDRCGRWPTFVGGGPSAW